jgi:hypothetical protein
MNTVLESLEQAELNEVEARMKAFRDLVVAIGDDMAVETDRVKVVLRDASKSVGDLKSAVELYQRRRAQASIIRVYREKEAERPEIDRQYQKALEKLERAKREFHSVADPLAWKIEEINEARRAAYSAEQDLRSTCADPMLLKRSREIDMQRQNLYRQQQSINETIHRLKLIIDRSATDSPTQSMGESQQKKEITAAQKRLEVAKAELAEVQAKDKQLEAEAAELDAQRLIP